MPNCYELFTEATVRACESNIFASQIDTQDAEGTTSANQTLQTAWTSGGGVNPEASALAAQMVATLAWLQGGQQGNAPSNGLQLNGGPVTNADEFTTWLNQNLTQDNQYDFSIPSLDCLTEISNEFGDPNNDNTIILNYQTQYNIQEQPESLAAQVAATLAWLNTNPPPSGGSGPPNGLMYNGQPVSTQSEFYSWVQQYLTLGYQYDFSQTSVSALLNVSSGFASNPNSGIANDSNDTTTLNGILTSWSSTLTSIAQNENQGDATNAKGDNAALQADQSNLSNISQLQTTMSNAAGNFVSLLQQSY